MYKSQPQLMIRENAQISAVKLAVCYQYRTGGVHASSEVSLNKKPLIIKLLGIDKDGEHEIASCPLETTAGYASNGYASNVVIGIPEKDYPYMCFSYDTSLAPDFNKMVGVSNLFVDIKPYPDILDATVSTDATLT